MDKYIKTSDGIELRYKSNLVEKPKGIVIINHGFAEHLDRYDFITSKLNSGGYCVYRYDLRGHGKTKSKKGDIDSFKKFAEDAQEIVGLAKKENNTKSIYMLGHSMGGFITCLYGIIYPDELDGQILSGPAVDTLPKASGFNGKAISFLSKFIGKLNFPNIIADEISSVDKVVEDFKKDPLVLKKTSIRFLNQFLIEGTNYVKKHMADYKYPCLICHGGADKIVPVEIGQYLYENIGSEDKKIKIYDGLYHEILNEKEKHQVAEDMLAWLDEKSEK